jgi:flagellar protein FliS
VEQMRLGSVEKTHTHLVKSKNIVAELMASLNMDKGGEVAKNLRSLYSYMFGQLIESNMSKNPEPALLVRKLLMELREAWVTIGKKSPGTQPATATSQPSMGAQAGMAPRAATALGGSPRQPTSSEQAGERRINLRG